MILSRALEQDPALRYEKGLQASPASPAVIDARAIVEEIDSAGGRGRS